MNANIDFNCIATYVCLSNMQDCDWSTLVEGDCVSLNDISSYNNTVNIINVSMQTLYIIICLVLHDATDRFVCVFTVLCTGINLG